LLNDLNALVSLKSSRCKQVKEVIPVLVHEAQMPRRDEAAEVGQSTQRALLTVCVLGVILVVSIGIWLADAHRTPLPPEATPKQPLPTPMQVPITPVPSAFSGVLLLSPERELAITPKEGFRECNHCSEMVAPAGSFTNPVALLSHDRERALRPKERFKECDNCPEMVVVPAGRFTMGSPDSEQRHDPDESPQHSVMFALQFAVGVGRLSWRLLEPEGHPPSGRRQAAPELRGPCQ
jgi:formylglycine-generating enzyme required for sulfatase activity